MNLPRIIIALLLTVALGHAADAPPTPTATHRVLGLCYPERVDDLRAALKDRSDVTLVSVDYERAEATFAYDPKKLSAESLGHVVGAKGFNIKPASTTPADKLNRIEIPVAGLDCKGCALGTYNAIGRIDGVERATVDFKTGLVVVVAEVGKTDRAALEDALKKAGVTIRMP